MTVGLMKQRAFTRACSHEMQANVSDQMTCVPPLIFLNLLLNYPLINTTTLPLLTYRRR